MSCFDHSVDDARGNAEALLDFAQALAIKMRFE